MTIGLVSFTSRLPYSGPGDITSAYAWWGFRAYSAGTKGANCVEIYNVNTTGTQIFNTLQTGKLDISGITSFLAGSAGKVRTFYDQTGNGIHLQQTTVANMPDFVFKTPGLGGNNPSLKFSPGQFLTSSGTGPAQNTGTFSTMHIRTNYVAPTTDNASLINAGGNGVIFDTRDNAIMAQSSTGLIQFIDDGIPLSAEWVFNGASSFCYHHGAASASVNPGTNNFNGVFQMGLRGGVSLFTGHIVEAGFFSSAFSTATCAQMQTNKENFWWQGSVYEGLVASRARIPETVDATKLFLMTRSAHFASENLTSFRAVWWLKQAVGTQMTAAVEYPAGTFMQMKFLGVNTSPYGQSSQYTFSDYVNVTIPAGAQFWIRMWVNGSAGIAYNTWQNSFLGEATQISATSISDLTMGGTITNSGAFSAPPLAILSETSNPTAVFLGDSIQYGLGDTEDNSASNTGFNAVKGFTARAMSADGIPFLNAGQPGAAATSYTFFRLTWRMGSHIYCNLGTNDYFNNSETYAQVITALSGLFGRLRPNQKIFLETIIPRDKTVVAAEASRVSHNTNVRNGTTGLAIAGFSDVDVPIEAILNGGDWFSGSTYTADFVHPNLAGNNLIANSGVITAPTWP